MDIGSLLLIFSILILVALFIIRPFFEQKHQTNDFNSKEQSESLELDHQYSSLMAEKERLLRALTELETDFAMGKIPEEDYPIQRANFLSDGARVLQALDVLDEKIEHPPELNAQLPEEKLNSESNQTSSGGMDPIEEMISTRRRLRDEKSAGFCPRCGKVIQKSDVFCPRCGVKVVA
jgi:hypothetical protein